VHITATANGRSLATSTVQVGGQPVGTTTITGRFYAAADRCTFTTPPNAPPLFVEPFRTVNFGGRPFAEYGATADQQPQVAAGGRYTAGVGRLSNFNAAFTGTFVVRRPRDTVFTFLIDDAFDFGVGGGARRVRGTLSNPPASGLTAIERLPIVGAFNQGHLQATTHVTVRFPHPGPYAYELDYAECKLGGESLRLSADGQFLPTVK
jgi:hypothetical protein